MFPSYYTVKKSLAVFSLGHELVGFFSIHSMRRKRIAALYNSRWVVLFVPYTVVQYLYKLADYSLNSVNRFVAYREAQVVYFTT